MEMGDFIDMIEESINILRIVFYYNFQIFMIWTVEMEAFDLIAP